LEAESWERENQAGRTVFSDPLGDRIGGSFLSSLEFDIEDIVAALVDLSIRHQTIRLSYLSEIEFRICRGVRLSACISMKVTITAA
jgi:hypothetical protein